MSAFSAGEDWLAPARRAILGQENEERVNGPSPLLGIETRVWQLQKPDGTVRSDHVMLCANGTITGYKHVNEAAWAPHARGIAFLAADGRITSVAQDISQNETGAWRIAMVHPLNHNKPAHLLIERLAGVETDPALASQPAPDQTSPDDRLNGSQYLLLPSLKRAILLANNHDLGAAWCESASFGTSDLLVQFNRPFYFEPMREMACHKMHVFNARMGKFWGFDDQGEPEREYQTQTAESLTFLFANNRPVTLAAYLARLPKDIQQLSIRPLEDLPDFTYPAGKWPSAGYAAVTLLQLINRLRRARGERELSIKLVGFTGHYPPGGAWSGHDFAFEQATYQSWQDSGLIEKSSTDL